MAKLTIKQLEAFTAEDHGKVFREDGGLVAEVRAGVRGVTVQFSYEFKLDGSRTRKRLGSWPKKSLVQIRSERDEARTLVTKGLHPTLAAKAARIEAQAAVAATIAEAEREAAENKTVADLFDEWIRDGVSRQDGNAELIRSFKKDVLPLIGKKPLRSLTEKDLLTVLRSVKARGLNRTVVIRSKDIGQMLRWGEKRKPWRTLMADGNPADLIDVSKLLDHDYEEQRDRLLSPDEIRELRDIFERLERDYEALPAGQKYSGIRPVNLRVQCAVWICLPVKPCGSMKTHVDIDQHRIDPAWAAWQLPTPIHARYFFCLERPKLRGFVTSADGRDDVLRLFPRATEMADHLVPEAEPGSIPAPRTQPTLQPYPPKQLSQGSSPPS